MGRKPKATLSAEFVRLLQQVGGAIAAVRTERGISQAELARRAGVSNTTLNEIETRQFRDVRLSTLSSIAEALSVPVSYLFENSNLDLSLTDQTRLLRASETILQITKKLPKSSR